MRTLSAFGGCYVFLLGYLGSLKKKNLFGENVKLAQGTLVYLLNQSGFAGHNSPFISCGFQFSESDGWAKDVCFEMNVKIDKYISYFFVKVFDNKLRLRY